MSIISSKDFTFITGVTGPIGVQSPDQNNEAKMKQFKWICLHFTFCGIAGIVACISVPLIFKTLGAEKYLNFLFFLFMPLDEFFRIHKIQTDRFDVSIPLVLGYMAFLGIVTGSIIAFLCACFKKTKFDVILKGFAADKKIGIMKVVHAATGASFGEVKTLVDNAGSTCKIKSGISKEDAERLKNEIEKNGGQVRIK